MENYEIKKEISRTLLEYALKNRHLIQYICNNGIYRTYSEKEEKINGYPTQLIMQTIYQKYLESPELNLDKLMYEDIKRMLEITYNGRMLVNLLNIIEYQLMEEKDLKAPFKIDCENLLRKMAENIKNNKERYIATGINENNEGYYSDFKAHDDYLNFHYGQKILY